MSIDHEGRLWRAVAGGYEVWVRASPGASLDLVDGPGEDAAGKRFLKVRVRAVAEKGKANAAVAGVLAKALGVPGSAVAVVAGETARIKKVRISSSADIAERLEALCAPR